MAQKRRRQHSKGKHRPRGWHMGAAQGKINERLMVEKIEPTFAAAEADLADVKASAARSREEIRDHQEILRQIDRTAPFVPRLDLGVAV